MKRATQKASLFFLLFFLCSAGASAQATLSLFRTDNPAGTPDNIYINNGSSLTFQAELVNNSNGVFQPFNSASLSYAFRSQNESSSGVVGNTGNSDSVAIAPGGSLPVTVTIPIGGPIFTAVGPDVIVVWPTGIGSWQVEDSLFIAVEKLLDPLAVIDERFKDLRIWRVNDQLVFSNSSLQGNNFSVRIFNALGQVLQTREGEMPKQISIASLPQGMYFCEVAQGNSRVVVRFGK